MKTILGEIRCRYRWSAYLRAWQKEFVLEEENVSKNNDSVNDNGRRISIGKAGTSGVSDNKNMEE